MKKHKPCPHRLSTIGPEEEQQEVEAHHTVLFGDGDVVSVQNKVSFDFVLYLFIIHHYIIMMFFWWFCGV